jgi:hypothetical protein
MTGTQPAFSFQPPAPPALPPNYGFQDLAKFEEGKRNAFGQNAQADILSQRDKLSTTLNDYGKKFFAAQNPAILEDLNARGLLTSPTEVTRSQTDALKDIEISNQNYLRDLDTSALSARLQAEQDALDSSSDLQRGDLEARIAEANASREETMARDLAKQQGRNSLYSSLIGAGGSLGSSLLTAKLFGAGGAGAAGAGGAGAGGAAAFLPAGLALGGIMGYRALPDKGLISKSTIAPLVNPVKTVKAISSGASSVAKKVSKAFCFDGDTEVVMADGTKKRICDISLKDETKGGIVESIRASIAPEGTLYNYVGTKVTGKHAVKENGGWTRVEDSIYASPVSGDGIVFSLVTSSHRVYVESTTFADEHETDAYESLNLDESLNELNRQDGLVGVN